VHPAALPANIIEGNSRMLFYPTETATNPNAGRGDGENSLCHGYRFVAARRE
jgi:hypothetical protein